MTATLAEGRYRLERVLGHGGMATVYLAEDHDLRRAVAIKQLAANLAADEELRERFLREARMAARLSHPNVVQIYDAGDCELGPYIVMEYVPGTTVAARGQLPFEEAVQLALQACAGLQHAHEAGLVHRDIKPANLLLRDDGVLKIADFGIARAAEATRLTRVGTILGTAAYLAPEQAAGEDVSRAADLYSLGAVLYELLTGRSPHRFESLADLVAKQQSGVITPVRDLAPSVPEALEAVVMRCLAREPSFRPTSAAELAQELAGAADVPTEPSLASELTEPRQPWKPATVPVWRSRWWLAGAVAVALVAAAVGLASLGDDGNAPKPPSRVPIAPPMRGATAAQEARNLSAWLRSYSATR
jgi:eukaryotic-like serine/threonine-protein kinase